MPAMPLAFAPHAPLRAPQLPRFPPRRRPTTRLRPAACAAPARTFADLFPPPAATSSAVLTASGAPASLAEYVASHTTAHRPVLLGWLRHYGCTLCKKQAADWRDLLPQLRACGDVAVALVGNGTPEQARDFVSEMAWEGDLFTDPGRRTYAALQFRKGLGSTFTLGAIAKVVESFGEGNKQTWRRLPTDAFQQGGAVLVGKDGTLGLFHRDAFAGDHLHVEEIFERVCQACKEGEAVV